MDLKALRAAVEPLSKFGSEELEFEIEGTRVWLRPILPDEEVAVQQYSAAVLATTQEEEGLGEEDPLSRAAALRYMDRFRSEVIAYALVQVNGTNLRNVKFIETGELVGEDGDIPERIPKHVALRKIIQESWSRGMITVAFAKFGDLVTQIAEKADKVAKESVADLDAEISRLEKRLANVRAERESRAKGDPSVTMKQIKTIVDIGAAIEREVDETIDQVREDERVRDNLRAAFEEEATVLRAKAAAFVAESEVPKRKSVIPDTAPPPTPRVKPPPPSSFEDSEELMEADRIALATRKAREVGNSNLGTPSLEGATQIASLGRTAAGEEIPTFSLPSADLTKPIRRETETISSRGKGKPKRPEIDPDPHKGTENPNFRPPNQG